MQPHLSLHESQLPSDLKAIKLLQPQAEFIARLRVDITLLISNPFSFTELPCVQRPLSSPLIDRTKRSTVKLQYPPFLMRLHTLILWIIY
jgi:hypothetical protein